jgi:hypothetical protein
MGLSRLRRALPIWLRIHRGAHAPAVKHGLPIKDRAPFISILEKTPADLRLVEEELKAVALPRLQRAQVVRQVAKAVGVTAKDLLTAISPAEADSGHDRMVKLVDETTPWDGLVNGEELLRKIYKLVGQVIWMPEPARMTVAFWLIASYAFKTFQRFRICGSNRRTRTAANRLWWTSSPSWSLTQRLL